MVRISYIILRWSGATFVRCLLLLTLRNLAITYNFITYIPVDYFKGFTTLQTLFLTMNHLIQFPDVHPLNHTLKSLFLLLNRIKIIPQSVIPSCPKLKQLNIKRNMLQTLDGSLFVGRSAAMRVTMSANPWRCDSSLAWLCNLEYGNFTEDISGRQLQLRMFGRARFSEYNFLECAQPHLYARAKIRDLSMIIDFPVRTPP